MNCAVGAAFPFRIMSPLTGDQRSAGLESILQSGGALDINFSTHIYGHMKTTIELPDALFRHAKMLAVRRGTSMRELVIEGLKRIVENHDGPAESGFVLTKQEAKIMTIGASGLPVLKRIGGARKKPVTNELVDRIREELSI